MKAHIQHLSPLPALIAGLALILAGQAKAQVFKTLHTFTGGSDGANPFAGLILSGSTLYGTTIFGTSSGYGTVFKVNTDGTGFKVLESFNGGNNEAYPETTLLLSGNTLYGASGGPGASSTLFAVNTNGTGFTTRYTFTPVSGAALTNRDGANTFGTMILSGNTLYGAACYGGSGGSGTVYAVNTNGTGFTTLYTFKATSPARDGVTHNPPYTNSDGVGPSDGVILSGDTLYGMTEYGGSSGWGTVYTINTNGTGFTNLYTFTGGSDGGWPFTGPLVVSGNTLYGTTMRGGSAGGKSGNGTVFAVNIDGTGFTNLHIFSATNALHINSDGASPSGGVILSGNTLYGTTQFGGESGNGTVYAVNTDGTGFTTLHSFAAQPNLSPGGWIPSGGVILSGNTLYGTTHSLGISGKGTLFSLSFRPQLTINPSETSAVLAWPANYAGFDYAGYTLQSTTNLVSPAWTTNSTTPVVVNGQNTVTNPISGTQQFFRLSQ